MTEEPDDMKRKNTRNEERDDKKPESTINEEPDDKKHRKKNVKNVIIVEVLRVKDEMYQ